MTDKIHIFMQVNTYNDFVTKKLYKTVQNAKIKINFIKLLIIAQ